MTAAAVPCMRPRLSTDFYARPVHEVATDLIGCVVGHAEAAGRIVEVEAYHESEPACHAHIGLTPRTATLFGRPGVAYVYRSYGIHALLNVVTDDEGIGAAVLIRALEPLGGIELMRTRRGRTGLDGDDRDLCSGPGKLTQALAVGMELNGSPLEDGPIAVEPRPPDAPVPRIVSGPRIGIAKAAELPWRYCDASSPCVSRPWPAAMRERRRSPGRRAA